jgi:hypothetical protein
MVRRKKPKIGQIFITITLEAFEDLLVGLLLGKGLVTILDVLNIN